MEMQLLFQHRLFPTHAIRPFRRHVQVPYRAGRRSLLRGVTEQRLDLRTRRGAQPLIGKIRDAMAGCDATKPAMAAMTDASATVRRRKLLSLMRVLP